MLGPEKVPHAVLTARVLAPIFLRWSCVLNAPSDEASDQYKDLTRLTLAAVLHRHGFQEQGLTHSALRAIDTLNDQVVLSDSFYRNSETIKAFISAPPTPLSRRPPISKNVTFYRAGDAASVQVGEWFYAIYIHSILGNHEAPVVEVYDFASRQRPGPEDLRQCRARGKRYNDGVERISHHAPYGLRDLPDKANQFHFIASGLPAPSVDHLQPQVGLFAVSDPFSLMQDIQQLFGHDA